jgi:hypothetical protein
MTRWLRTLPILPAHSAASSCSAACTPHPASTSLTSTSAALPAPQQTPSDVIPRFYFPSAGAASEAVRLQYLQKVDHLFAPYPQGMPTDAFKDVLAQVGLAGGAGSPACCSTGTGEALAQQQCVGSRPCCTSGA